MLTSTTGHLGRVFRFAIICSFLLTATLFLAACGGGGGGNSVSNPPPPTITSVSVTCNPTSVQIGQTSQCTATVTGTGSYSSAVTWSASAGTINSSGLFTAPSTAGTVTVTATATQDATKSRTATITVTLPPTITSVSVTCNPTSVQTGQTSQCTATVAGTGSYSSAVTWSASAGTINSSGLFTAPGTASTVTVTATSVQDSTKAGNTTVTVTTPPPTITSVSVSCNPTSVQTGQTLQCTATVAGTGSYNSAVTWSVNNMAGGNATLGTISASGLYTAPGVVPSPAQVTVTATSQADPTKSASAIISILAPASLQVISSSPQNGATGVSVTATIQIQFNQSLNPASITGATVTLASGSGILPAGLSYESTTNTVTITPAGSLASNAVYTVTVGTGVTGASGGSLTTPFALSFTTQAPVGVNGTVFPPANFDPASLTVVSLGQASAPQPDGSFTAQVQTEGVTPVMAMVPGKAFGLMAIAIGNSGSTTGSETDLHAEVRSSRRPVHRTKWQVTRSNLAANIGSNLLVDFQTTAESLAFMSFSLFTSVANDAANATIHRCWSAFQTSSHCYRPERFRTPGSWGSQSGFPASRPFQKGECSSWNLSR